MGLWIFFLGAMLVLGGCKAQSPESGLFQNVQETSRETGMWSLFSDHLQEAPKDVSSGEVLGDLVNYDHFFLGEGNHYCYNTLTLAERIWYEDMENILGSLAEKGELSQEGIVQGLTENDIDHIFQCVMMDHPEFFFVDGYVYGVSRMGEKLIKLEFSGSYHTTREEAVQKKQQIEQAAERIVLNCPQASDDYEKIKYVYETLILETEYDPDAPDNQNIYSVFVGKKSVCQGYAKATQYLLNQLGVECTLVSGMVQGGNRHGWNLVRSDGEYYFVDTTWGDASYKLTEEKQYMEMPEINYDYLCVTSDELSRTHYLDESIEVPSCVSIRDNYYVREGAYFTELDQTQLRALFEKTSEEQSYRVTLKCADFDVYEQMKRLLLEEGNVFQYYQAPVSGVVYVKNDEQYSLTFWVTNS